MPPRGRGLPWALTLGWVAVCVLALFGLPNAEAGLDPLRVLMIPVAVGGPIALVWAMHAMLGRVAALAEQVASLDAAPRRAAPPRDEAALIETLEQIARTQARIEAQLARRSADVPPPQRPAERTVGVIPRVADDEPLSPRDFTRALQFPADPDDRAGFAAMRRALSDPQAAPLVRAAQDVLTLLSQDGLYMDDLHPDAVPAAVWRAYAAGERGEAVDALAAVRAPEAVGLVTQRMRADTIFRDAAHHFTRLFDQSLALRTREFDDDDLQALSDTRSAHAFRLLSRATNNFE